MNKMKIPIQLNYYKTFQLHCSELLQCNLQFWNPKFLNFIADSDFTLMFQELQNDYVEANYVCAST